MGWNLFKRRKKKTDNFEANYKFEPKVLYKPKNLTGGLKRSGARAFSNFPYKKILFGALFIILVTTIVTLIYQFVRHPYFLIKNFQIIGNQNITDNEIIESLYRYNGLHIYLANNESVEEQILKSFPIVDGVVVDKIWPDKLFIKISEREPKAVLINLNGAYLIDESGRILTTIIKNEVDFSDNKIIIGRGFGSPEDPLVKAVLQNEFLIKMGLDDVTPEEQQKALSEQFVFDLININEKERVLNSLKDLYISEAKGYWKLNESIVDGTKYKAFPQVKILNNSNYTENEDIDIDRLNLTLEASSFLNKRNVPIEEIYWEGELLVRFESNNGKYIIFGLNRKSSIQFEDLLIIFADLSKRGKDYKLIDVSATKVLVVQ